MMTETDHADLERAEQMKADGKALRARVLKRIRQRKWRAGVRERQA